MAGAKGPRRKDNFVRSGATGLSKTYIASVSAGGPRIFIKAKRRRLDGKKGKPRREKGHEWGEGLKPVGRSGGVLSKNPRCLNGNKGLSQRRSLPSGGGKGQRERASAL